MKNGVVISILCAALAFVACRREVHHEPLKLGVGDIAVQQPARQASPFSSDVAFAGRPRSTAGLFCFGRTM